MPGLSEKLVTEFEDLLRQRPWASYGSQAQSQIKQKKESKKAPPEATLKFSIFPAAEPETFTPDELYDLSTDTGFASTILESYTGKKPTAQQVSLLQSRVKEKYPDLQDLENQFFESPRDVMKRMIEVMDIGSKTGNFKPYVDLIISHPGIAPEFLEEAKKIKKSGYKETPATQSGFNALRAQAKALTPQAKEGLLSHVERTGSFSSGAANLHHAFNPVGFEASASPEAKRAMSQDQALKKSVEAIKAAKSERSKATPIRMREARDIEKEVEHLKDVSKRIAPLNKVHEQAEQLLNRGIGSDTLATARNKLAAAEQMDVPAEIAPYLQAANKPTQELIQEFMTNYGPVIEGFRREAAKDFLEHDLPKINSEFASKGAFFSGAREAALNKARVDKEARIEREISKLMTHGHEQAMKHSHAHREGKLKSAEIAGNARKSQKESLQHAAEALRANAQVEQAGNLANFGALSNIARTQQEQAQHEIDTRMAQHREEQERPFVELSRKSALAQGHPLPAFNFSPMGINPPPPNVYSLGANVLGHAAGLHKMGYSNEAPFKKGGHVRRKYAKGGPIARHASEWQQIGQHTQGTPSAQIADESMREAQAMRHHRIDPQGAYLMALTSHQMANPGKSMMQTFGEGTQKAYDAFNAAKAYNVDSKSKYINLINAIDKSRQDTQNLLANYHIKKSHHEETQRYHNMANAESVRHNNMMHERYTEKTEKPIKRSAIEMKLEHDAQKDLSRAIRMKKEINNLGGLITKTETGPVYGFAKSLWPKTKIDNKIEVATNKLILDMHQGMKNIPRSEEFLKRIETTKPNRSNYLEANQQSLDMMNQGADDVMEHAITTLLSAGHSPEQIEKRFKVKIPRHLLEGEAEEDNPEPEPANDNEYTWMKFPGESKEIEVANEDVAKALERGAKIV